MSRCRRRDRTDRLFTSTFLFYSEAMGLDPEAQSPQKTSDLVSEASREAGQFQLLDGPLVAEGGSGDATGGTPFFAQPHLPVGTK